ncbi:energy-converting hydrogenase A subunit D [Methanomicrobium sp. W14]|uniref:DUF2108 domain-containing protein n=1 Tax=Methanomicrobium sp. W14 TaxID=2817839 RepID=UPI001AE78DF4|nr:DUF2108 domain-containing protein [Methanomicrobium sp. W14]MBP2132346.1 energy-converting hydrogenase A subunit D [Methanomicrobium sp. W14]
MNNVLLVIFAFIAVAGAAGTAVQKNPYDKLISLGMLFAGVIPFIIESGYFDVAIALSLIIPMTTIIMLQAVWRCRR